MPLDHSLIGQSSPPRTFEVTREAVQRFMEATEDPALSGGEAIGIRASHVSDDFSNAYSWT